MPRMTVAELEALMDQHFEGWRRFSTIVRLDDNDITVRMPFRKKLKLRKIELRFRGGAEAPPGEAAPAEAPRDAS